MRNDAICLEEGRLTGLNYENYPWLHERHRIFPDIFRKKRHKRILDLAAGVGVVGHRIMKGYECELVCNEITPKCLKILHENGITTTSFDLDEPEKAFPFPDGEFDAVISLATCEHIINLDHHMKEVRRILGKDGRLYISTPNYSGIHFFIKYLLFGESFHDPLKEGLSRYEFFAHVRYFTYKTLLRFVSSYGFKAEEVYLPVPKDSSKFRKLKANSRCCAQAVQYMMYCFYSVMSPRWALHPVLCFSRSDRFDGDLARPKKVVL